TFWPGDATARSLAPSHTLHRLDALITREQNNIARSRLDAHRMARRCLCVTGHPAERRSVGLVPTDRPLLAGKRIIVTGASRGLGRAFATAAAAHGASVVINGTNEALLSETARAIAATGGRCVQVVGSVADEDSCKRIIDRAVETFGGIDCLVNNAGIVRD